MDDEKTYRVIKLDGENYRLVGTGTNGIPIYAEINPMTYSKPESDALSLMTELVRELRKENEDLKRSLIESKFYGRAIDNLGKQMSDVENGKVVQR